MYEYGLLTPVTREVILMEISYGMMMHMLASLTSHV